MHEEIRIKINSQRTRYVMDRTIVVSIWMVNTNTVQYVIKILYTGCRYTFGA